MDDCRSHGLMGSALSHDVGVGCPVMLKRYNMDAMNYRERIMRDPQIVGGQPIFRNTRVTLRTVLASLAEGGTPEEILADFPTLSAEDIRAAIAFAATSAQEDLPLAESPIKR